MDLFTHHSDLDLSINFSDSTDDQYTHKKKYMHLGNLPKFYILIRVSIAMLSSSLIIHS
jgi:hypothetical protein